MDEYISRNIKNNKPKKYIEISHDKISFQKIPYKIERLKPIVTSIDNSYGSVPKKKNSNKNFIKINPLDIRKISNRASWETPTIIRKNERNNSELSHAKIPKSSILIRHIESGDEKLRINNRRILDNEFGNERKLSQQKLMINSLNNHYYKSKNIFNNNTFINKTDLEMNDMNLKNIAYEKKINDLNIKNNNLINKIKFYLNDINSKDKKISFLEYKIQNLQKESNKNNSTQRIIIENKTKQINNKQNNCLAFAYSSKISPKKKDNKNLNNIINSKNKDIYKSNQNIKINASKDYKPMNIIEIKNNNYNIPKANINRSDEMALKSDDDNNKKIIQQKDGQIKALYQKIKKMKKNIELMSLKSSNLSKLLTKKNIDLITYQKNEIELEKKIENLTSLLYKQNSPITNENIKESFKKESINANIRQSKENELLKNEIQSKASLIKELNEENEEKTKQIEDLSKKINDLEIDIKDIKYEEKQNFFDIKNYKEILSKNEEEKKSMILKLKKYEEEKNKLINDINNKNKENNNNKNIIIELNDDIKKYKTEIEQKNNEINKCKSDNQELIKQIRGSSKEKETDLFIKKIEELSNQNRNLLEQINNITDKYQKQKKILTETKKELENMREVSKSLLEKEKAKAIENDINSHINPNTYSIITNKKYKKLVWYLMLKKSNENSKEDENNYNNYQWVSNLVLKNEDLKKYNNFEDENDKNKELKEYAFNLQKKLENKEEFINKLDYQNKKLTNQLHNKTANLKGNSILAKNSKDVNLSNSLNNMESKYKNILEKLNQSNQREKHLHNQINILKEKLNEQNNLENTFPHDIKNIEPNHQDSGFLDDDFDENRNGHEIQNVLNKEIKDNNANNNKNQGIGKNENEKNYININDNGNIKKLNIKEMLNNEGELNKSIKSSNNDPFKESEKLVDEFLMKGAGEEDDFDEIKMISKQMNFLKDEIKENREKYKKLGNEVKNLFSIIKCNDKNRKSIVQICQLLGFKPELINQFISNKKPKK